MRCSIWRSRLLMAYEQLRKQLEQNVAEFLFELVSDREYPIHPFVGLWGFTEGLRNCGVGVSLDKDRKEASFKMGLPLKGRIFPVCTSMPYSGIIAGAGSIPGSPSAYEESSFDLIIQAEFVLDGLEGFEISDSQELALSRFLAEQQQRYFGAMKSVWLEFFERFHDNVLVAVDSTVSRLEKSSLIDIVLGEGDLQEYFGVCSDGDEEDRADFEMYFNDKFLQELRLVKGYCIHAPCLGKIEYSPLDWLMHGSQMHWRNLERLVV